MATRAFSCADNLAYLRRAGGHYIAGIRMRDGNPLVEQVLSRQGRYQQVTCMLINARSRSNASWSASRCIRNQVTSSSYRPQGV